MLLIAEIHEFTTTSQILQVSCLSYLSNLWKTILTVAVLTILLLENNSLDQIIQSDSTCNKNPEVYHDAANSFISRLL